MSTRGIHKQTRESESDRVEIGSIFGHDLTGVRLRHRVVCAGSRRGEDIMHKGQRVTWSRKIEVPVRDFVLVISRLWPGVYSVTTWI
jgi:hypothetical protein